ISFREMLPFLLSSGMQNVNYSIIAFCSWRLHNVFRESISFSRSMRAVNKEVSRVISLQYATTKEYDYGTKLVVLAHEPQKALEDRNKLWYASVEGRLIFFAYKYTKHARMHKFYDL
ncbi:hypothetical protein AAVH_33014, partial [Aphelenchoides avenae]